MLRPVVAEKLSKLQIVLSFLYSMDVLFAAISFYNAVLL